MQKCVNERPPDGQNVTPRVRIEIFAEGALSRIAEAAEINVDPVVHTSSTRSIPLLSRRAGDGSENIPEVLSSRCWRVIDV